MRDRSHGDGAAQPVGGAQRVGRRRRALADAGHDTVSSQALAEAVKLLGI